jgi:hypothetical protein
MVCLRQKGSQRTTKINGLSLFQKSDAYLLITPHMFVCLISLIKEDIFYLLTLNCTIVVYASSYQITKINFLLLLIVFRPK